MKAQAIFAPRLAALSRDRIAGVEELKAAGVLFHPNPEIAKGKKHGIPQGTPISAAASNLYMIDFDAAAKAHCDGIGALYRRYSDDIMVVCDPAQAVAVEAEVMRLIANELLEINPAKTERTDFGAAAHLPRSSRAAQYLGFTLHDVLVHRHGRVVSLRRGHVNHPFRLLAGKIFLYRHVSRNNQDPAHVDGGVYLKGDAFAVSVPRFQQEQVGDHVALVCGGSQAGQSKTGLGRFAHI